jgi:toxin ParE1/3/4
MGRVEGTRELVIRGLPFIVIYRVTVDSVDLLAVIHGAQQYPT